jgi:hypothetical protein
MSRAGITTNRMRVRHSLGQMPGFSLSDSGKSRSREERTAPRIPRRIAAVEGKSCNANGAGIAADPTLTSAWMI